MEMLSFCEEEPLTHCGRQMTERPSPRSLPTTEDQLGEVLPLADDVKSSRIGELSRSRPLKEESAFLNDVMAIPVEAARDVSLDPTLRRALAKWFVTTFAPSMLNTFRRAGRILTTRYRPEQATDQMVLRMRSHDLTRPGESSF